MSASKNRVRQRIDPIQAIVLDFDGTLVDSIDVKAQAFFDLFLPYGEDVAIRAREHHLDHQGVSRKIKIEHIVREFELPSGESFRDRLAEQFASLVVEQVVACPSLPGALEFLRHHSLRLPIFLVSATPEPELHEIVERRGISSFFTASFGSPTAKQFSLLQILRDYEFTSHDVLAIGDSLSDLEASLMRHTRFIGLMTSGTMWPVGTTTANSLADISLMTGPHP